MGRCILHGRVRANRSPWRVRNRLHAGSGRFPCPAWRLEASCLPVRFRAGTLRASLMRPQSAGFPNGSRTRIRRTGCGVEQFPCRRHARQRLHPVRGTEASSPTQQWEESPESPRAALAPVRRGDGRRCIPRIRGADPGLRRRPKTVTPSNHAVRRLGSLPGASPSGTGDRGGAGRCARRIRGAGAPHRHTLTDNRGVTQGREHPVHRGPSGWMVAYAGSGTPGRRPAGVTAARPPCGGRSGFESRGGRRRPYDPLSDDPIRAVRVTPSDDGTLTALFHPLPRGA